jgi:phospholipid:diacylglycerol acyltransferase
MYGVGLPTERSYYYTKSKYRPSSADNDTCDADDKNKMDVSALLNGTNIKKEEFIKAVTCSNREGNNSEINRPPSIVSCIEENVYIRLNSRCKIVY